MKDFLGNIITVGNYCLYSEDGSMRLGKIVGLLRGGDMVQIWRTDDESKDKVLKPSSSIYTMETYAV